MKEMTVALLFLLGLLCWPLVNSQTFPYVSFMGQTLANHSYVNLSLVGSDSSDRNDYYSDSNSVQCHTDLTTCCSGREGPSLMELNCLSLVVLVISSSLAELRELKYIVETMLTHQLVSITVIFQLLLSIMILTSQ